MMLQDYLPSRAEEQQVRAFETAEVAFVSNLVKSARLEADVVPVGSVPKGTFLRGSSDIDIFVVSPHFERLFQQAQVAIPEGQPKLGELLIWHYRKDGFEVDLVFIPPTYEEKIDTLKHTSFYQKALTPAMRNEIRKAKAYFITEGVYKAEVGGITGVAIEELVRQYGSLRSICQVFLRRKRQEWWLQDPTASRRRNLLASITPVRWKQIKSACREYLRAPKAITFRPFTYGMFAKRHEGKMLVTCDRQLDRAVDYLTADSLCHKSGHDLRDKEKGIRFFCDTFVDHNIIVAIETTPKHLSPNKEVCMPANMPRALHGFQQAHPDVELYPKNGEMCAVLPRRITEPERHLAREFMSRMRDRGYVCSAPL